MNEFEKIKLELSSLTGKARLEALCKSLSCCANSDYETAIEFGLEAIELADELGEMRLKFDALYDTGFLYLALNECEKSIDLLNRAIVVSEELDYEKGVADSLYFISVSYKAMSEFALALDYANRALEIREKLGETNRIAGTLNIIGSIHNKLGNFEDALGFYLRSLELLEKDFEPRVKISTLINVGVIYDKLKNYDMAQDYYLEALQLAQNTGNKSAISIVLVNFGSHFLTIKDSEKALSYFLDALEIKEELEEKAGISYCLNNVGLLYYEMEDYAKALEYYRESLSIKEELGDKEGMAASLMNIAMVQVNLKNYDEAEAIMKRTMDMVKRLKSKKLISEVYQGFADLYAARGDYKKALENYKTFSNFKDELYSEEMSRRIAEMQVKYETEKKERDAVIYRLKNVELAKANETISKKNEELTEAYQKMEELARTDPLTKLFNRRETQRLIDEEVEKFNSGDTVFSLILCDIDHFKLFNDDYGHDCGDYVLVEISDLMREVARDCDTIGRWGGEEFLILLPETDLEMAIQVAETLRAELEDARFNFAGQELNVTMTFGVSVFGENITSDECVKNADMALYEGKECGRNCVKYIRPGAAVKSAED